MFLLMKALYQKLKAINGKNYGLYKSLSERLWNFGDFELEFLHVQGDSYAPPSRIMVKAQLQTLGYSSEWSADFDRRLALSDFLYRRLGKLVAQKYSDKDAAIIFLQSGPQMLVRNSLWVDNGELRACLQVRLPSDGRKIQGELAAEILTMVLPDLVSSALYFNENFKEQLAAHYQVVAERSEILKKLDELGLVAFINDGAILPRESGLSEAPLQNAKPFISPENFAVTLDIFGKKIRGMGVPKGITVITGGAYHGKSTLLCALASSVYPHIPGDGREGIVVDTSAVNINVEDGRSVRATDLSQFVRNLPNGIDTKNFTTLKASGSTSEAANLLESIEAGASTFFIDEDSSAINFLIRGKRIRKLIGNDNEPIIPLTDNIKQMQQYNFILVAGACGDFLDLADNVIVMVNYKAECAKFGGKFLNEFAANELAYTSEKPFIAPEPRSFVSYIQPLLKHVRQTSVVERSVKVKLTGDSLLQIGFLLADTSKLKSLVDNQQRLGAGTIILNMCQNAASNSDEFCHKNIICIINDLLENIRNVGFRNLPQGLNREMSLPRAIDIASVIFRLCSKENSYL